MNAFRREYGAGPLHLLAVTASIAVAAYALSRVFDVVGEPPRVVLWLAGAIVAHDLVLFPLYALLGLIAGGALVPDARRSRLRIAALNHLRAPALASGLLLLVWFPLIAAKAPRTFMRSTGLDVGIYFDRWLLATAVLFTGSALLFALRRAPAGPFHAATIGVMGTRGSILVVDDEPTIADVVSRYLERAGYSARIAADGPGALRSAGEERPDLVVLDLMLPGMDGLEVMRRMREYGEGPRVSVILLTAKGEHADRIAGLQLGADDYVVKPFSPAELVARVDAVLRRIESPPELEEPIAFDELEVDPRARRATVRGEEAQLTVREFDLLLHFMRNPGQVFSRDQLMEAVWQYSFYTDTSTVTVHMRRLRSKIEADPSQPRTSRRSGASATASSHEPPKRRGQARHPLGAADGGRPCRGPRDRSRLRRP